MCIRAKATTCTRRRTARISASGSSAGFSTGSSYRLADAILELAAELSIKSLGKRVVTKKSHRRIPPGHGLRASKIARASQQLRGDRRWRGVKYVRLVSVLLFRDDVPGHF